MTDKKKIYAFLVGINEYSNPVPKLEGCRRDVESVFNYLKSLEQYELNHTILVDKAATKDRIVDTFEQFLGQAKENDVAFFYFSGHGTREEADPVFWKTDPDQKLQALIPYDGLLEVNGLTQYRLLANKELRYLIHQVSKNNPHILTIFDCCHSGGMTKDIKVKVRQHLNTRALSSAFPKRAWAQFVFSKEINPSDFQDKSLDELLPEGRHIHLAAALPEEVAYEWEGEGVFTKKLIEVLERLENKVTYYDLQSIIRQYIGHQFKQTPQAYASQEVPDEIFRFFLDETVEKGNRMYANAYHVTNKGWRMDMGQMHGLSKLIKEVKVYSRNDQTVFTARIGKIDIGETALFFDQETPSPKGYYKVYVTDFLSNPIKVYLNDNEKTKTGRDLIKAEWAEVGPNVYEVAEATSAEYAVQIENNAYQITYPNDPTRPLTQGIYGFQPGSAILLCQYLKHIAQWELVKKLHNPNSYLIKKHPILIEFIDEKGKSIPINNDEILMDYKKKAAILSGKFKVKLTNQYHERLHVSFLYLSLNFQIYAGFLKPKVMGIDAGKSAWVKNGTFFELDYEPQIEKYNWKYSATYFKIIISTRYFEVSPLELSALPGPDDQQTKAGRASIKAQQPKVDDWFTRLLTLKLKNPNYK